MNRSRFLACGFATFCFASFAAAAPMLRLATTTVGPVSVAAGAVPAAQTVEAYNAGDGSLALKLSSSVSWITTAVGSPAACTTTTAARTCIPLKFTLNTASLAAGMYTGIVTVSDGGSSTVDAPQTITVTVAVGGEVPASVDAWIAPSGSRDVPFSTNSPVYGYGMTQSGGQWLSLALDGSGSFRFVYPYRIHLEGNGLPEGTYKGSLVTSGSSFAPDNRTVPVTMRVTAQPIAQASVDRVSVRLAQGAPPLKNPFAPIVNVNNLGQGTLSVQPSAVSTASCGSWLTATSYNVGGLVPSGVVLEFDTGSIAPGTCSGTVTVPSNANNGAVTIPVDFEVVPKAPPLIAYQGVVDNGTYRAGDTVARGDVMIVKGEQLSFSPFASGAAPPLDKKIGGAEVLVNGSPAPMFYSSYGQLAFQMPMETPLGTAVVQVRRDDTDLSNAVSVNVADRAPRILVSGVGSYGVVTFPDYSRPMPAGSWPGVSTHPAAEGDVLTIWAIGLGPTSPSVATGAPAPGASGLAQLVETPLVYFGSGISPVSANPFFAGLSPNYAGLYQVNVTIPQGVPKGTAVDLRLAFTDSVSNAVSIAIQ